MHRERTPARRCALKGCKTWLASANEDRYCALHGGWSTQRMNIFDALGELPHKAIRRELVGDALEELMAA